MPYDMGWSGAQFSTPASGTSPGSAYASDTGGNSPDDVPAQAGGAPNWTGGLTMKGVAEVAFIAAVVVFGLTWWAHGHSLME